MVGQECPTTPDKSVRPNKSKQLSKQKEQAAAALPWRLLEADPGKLPLPFKKHCEDMFALKGDQSMGDFVGVCMDSWQLLGNKIPAPFAQAVKAFREREKTPPPAPITYLPDMPFQKRDWKMEDLCPKKS